MRVVLLTIACLPVLAAPAAAHGGDGVLTHMDTRDQLAEVNVAATAAAAAAPGALPYTWCGDERTTDNVVQSALPATSPRFKIVYAHPADRPDRFAGWKDALQANVALVQRFMAAQSGGAKALRIDMGTRCGPQYVDIQAVHLSRSRAAYVDNFRAMIGEVESRLGTIDAPRNVVVFADTLNGGSYDYGLGETCSARTATTPVPATCTTAVASARSCSAATASPHRARAPAAGGRRGCCTRSRTTSAACSGRPRTRRSRSAWPTRATATAGRATTSCATSRTPARRTPCATTARASAARSRRPTTADATTTSTPAARRQLPRHALERLRQRVPRPVRQDRARVRRGHGRPGARAARRHGGSAGQRRAAPRPADRRQRPARLRLPLAARAARPLGDHRRRQQLLLPPPPRRPRAPPARAGHRHQPRRQRIGRITAQRARGRRQGRPRAVADEQVVPAG